MSQTLTFDRWVLYGSGFTQSYQAKATISVARGYGSDTARVTVDAQMYSYGGDTNTNWICWVKIGSTWYSWTVSSGSVTHYAGQWYSSSHYWDISVGANSGTLSGQVTFQAYDTGAGVGAYSAYKDWSQSYGSKGASTISSATNVTLSTSVTVNSMVSWTAYSSSFTYSLTASCNGKTFTQTYSGLSGNTTQYFGFGADWIDYITTSQSATCTLTLTTLSGGVAVGSASSVNISLTVPSSGISPSVTIGTITKYQSNAFSSICTLDKISVPWSYTLYRYDSSKPGSPLTQAVIDIEGNIQNITGTPIVSNKTMTKIGLQTINIVITDARSNNSGNNFKQYACYEYYAPAVSVKYRHTGSDYYLDLGGRFASVNDENNTRILKLDVYKGATKVNQSDIILTSYINAKVNGSVTPYNDYYPISGSYQIPITNIDGQGTSIADITTETYEFRVSATDRITTTTASAKSGIPVMTFGAGGTYVEVNKPLKLTHTDNLWNNANNILLIDPLFSGDVWRVAQTSNSYPQDTPVGAITAEFFRQQFCWYNPNLYAVVVLYEVFPRAGRIWERIYDYGQANWSPWRQTSPYQMDAANGWTYKSYADGTFEAWYNADTSVNITTAGGGVYFGSLSSIAYPVTFTAKPLQIVTIAGITAGCWASYTGQSASETGTIWAYRGTSSAGHGISLNIYIKGNIS